MQQPSSGFTPRAVLALGALGALIPILGGFAGVARADDGPYVGIGATQTEVDDIYGEHLHLHNSVLKWIAGYRFVDFFGVEVDYANLGSQDAALLGSYSQGYAHADANEFSAYAVGYVPLPLVDLFAKAGAMRWQLASNAEIGGVPLYSVSQSGEEFAWGLGGQLQFGPFAPRLEWEHSNLPYSHGLDLWTLGLTFTF
jgi:OmpA-OmpF porin, OOP family